MTAEPRCESGTCIVHLHDHDGIHRLYNTRRPADVVWADQAEWDTFVAGIEAGYRARIVAALRQEAQRMDRYHGPESDAEAFAIAADMIERDFADGAVS
jgi:hypothetical protein